LFGGNADGPLHVLNVILFFVKRRRGCFIFDASSPATQILCKLQRGQALTGTSSFRGSERKKRFLPHWRTRGFHLGLDTETSLHPPRISSSNSGVRHENFNAELRRARDLDVSLPQLRSRRRDMNGLAWAWYLQPECGPGAPLSCEHSWG